ncbi:MAG: hypothetical protein GXO42_01140 [bacterium]|nr:hypothetical protein [bacterium]
MKVIITHKYADVDALACAVALKKLHEGAVLVFPEGLNKQARELLHRLGLQLEYYTTVEQLPQEEIEELVLVDTASLETAPGAEILAGRAKKVVVYDHHKPGKLPAGAELHLFDVPALSEAVYCLLKEKLEKQELILLACGILTDTRFLRLASAKTMAVLQEIIQRAGTTLEDLRRLLSLDQDYSQRVALVKAFKRMKVYVLMDKYFLAVTHSSSHESTIANSLVSSFADIAVVVAVKESESTVRIVCRTRNVPELPCAYELVKLLQERLGGSGGGHKHAAVLEIKVNKKLKKQTAVPAYLQQVVQVVIDAVGAGPGAYKELTV